MKTDFAALAARPGGEVHTSGRARSRADVMHPRAVFLSLKAGAIVALALAIFALNASTAAAFMSPPPSPKVTGQKCVLFCVKGCRAALADFNLDNAAVIETCEQHRLAPAFDVGLQSRRELRVMPSAIEFFKTTRGERTRRLLWPEICQELFLGRTVRDFIDGETARAILNIEGGHMNDLVDEGWLETVPGWRRRCGPGGCDRIKLDSFTEFLKARLL